MLYRNVWVRTIVKRALDDRGHHVGRAGRAAPDQSAATGAMKVLAMVKPSTRRSRATAPIVVILLALAVTAMGCSQAEQRLALDATGAPVPSFAPVIQEVMPAVVNVSAVQRVNQAAADREHWDASRSGSEGSFRELPPEALDEFLRHFLDPRHRKATLSPKVASVAMGSGFIIDPSGYVVTDDHVVENAEKVTVILDGATAYPARIVGRDPLTDLALLKIDVERPLSYVHWGDSDRARIGDWVLAIGSPFGLDNTVSSGIISGRGRDIHAGPYDDFLQIDAAINRGNSGGPTFDLHGNVIGINTAIYSPNGGSVGIGFAIPANRARPVVEQLKALGKVPRGWLGIQIQQVSLDLAQSLGLSSAAGALVVRIAAGSPAAAAGFEKGDVILSVNGRDIRQMRELPLVVAEMPIGQMVAVTVWRRNTALTLRPTITEMPVSPEVAELTPGASGGRRSERQTPLPALVSAAFPAI
jgi:serine protease Do